jgi:predicted tellurium resistance membrane protein TerC
MDLFTIENLASLGVLIFLQAVLGFDNLLYISIESQRAPEPARAGVRRWGILIALALRIVLLFGIMQLLESFQMPWFEIHAEGVLEGSFTFSTLVFLLGGGFLMYTAVKEISHLLAVEDLEHEEREAKSAAAVVAMIVTMNLIFSFDSILSALAITKVFALLAIAIVVSGILMLVLADAVSAFIERNRKYEVLGLFILLIVGVVLLGEGGHEAHLTLFGYAVEPMAKSTFYFSIFVLVLVDVIQSGYQNKLAAQRAKLQHAGEPA